MKNILIILIAMLTSCKVSEHATFLKNTWQCNETDGFVYEIVFQQINLDDNMYAVKNFHLMGSDIYAYFHIKGNIINIPEQKINIENISVGGSGVINNRKNKITLNYYFSDGADVDTVHAIYCLNNLKI